MFGALRLFVQVLSVLAVAMLVPAVIALVVGDADDAASFVSVAALVGFIASAVFFALRGRHWRLGRFDALFLVVLVWAVPPFIAAVPIMGGTELSYLPALFEAVSAYTTTGATVLPSLDQVGPAILLWRGQKPKSAVE